MAISPPSPSAPSRLASETRTSSKRTSEVSEARCPILSSFFPVETPGDSRGTTKADKPLCPRDRSVDAKTVYWEACAPFVMKHFLPLRTYPSPSLRAVVSIPPGSEPAPGSVRQKEANRNSVANGWTNALFSSSVPARRIGPNARPFAFIEVATPAHPQEISSSRMQVSRIVNPCPPRISGMNPVINPRSNAFRNSSSGKTPSLSHSAAWGRISLAANLWAISRSATCSGVGSNPSMSLTLPCGRAGHAQPLEKEPAQLGGGYGGMIFRFPRKDVRQGQLVQRAEDGAPSDADVQVGAEEPLPLPLFEDVADDLQILEELHRRVILQELGALPQLDLDDLDEPGLALKKVHVVFDEDPQAIDGAPAGRDPPAHVRHHLPHLLFEKGDQQVVLVPEVEVDGPVRDFGGPGDLGHLRVEEPFPGEDLHRGAEDPVPLLSGAVWSPPRHRTLPA